MELAKLEQPLELDLSLSAVTDIPTGASLCLARAGATLRLLCRANVFCRVLLGRQLALIQEQHIWDRMERPTNDARAETPSYYKGLDDFMTHGFPEMTGLIAKTGYAALKLGQSRIFRYMPEADLRKFGNLGNAFELIRLERSGVRIGEELIGAAQTLTVADLRRMNGLGKKASVEVVVDGSDRANVLQGIVGVLSMVDTGGLLALEEVMEDAMEQAEGNPTDAVDCMVAAVKEQRRQEGLQELNGSSGLRRWIRSY